jgi:DnaJ like chaperone protein
VLGCDERDSDEIIKRRHRELAKEFHADRLCDRTSPGGIHHANERFRRAQEAYEIIMIARKEGI